MEWDSLGMQREELGRRALLMGAGCTAMAMLGACDAFKSDGTENTSQPVEPVLIPAADVPVGGGVLTADAVLVLQLEEGEFTAFSATCPHKQYLVRPPDGEGIMTCSGHQSKFRAEDGVRVDGPALGDLTPIKVKVSGGNVVRA